MESRLKVGDIVYVEFVGYGHEMHKDPLKLNPMEVSSVGHKYFRIKGIDSNARFNLEDLSHDSKGYSARYYVYRSKKEALEYYVRHNYNTLVELYREHLNKLSAEELLNESKRVGLVIPACYLE